MTMTAIVIFHARPGMGQRLHSLLLDNFVNLKDSTGFIDNTVYWDTNDPRVFVEVESWTSTDTYRA